MDSSGAHLLTSRMTRGFTSIKYQRRFSERLSSGRSLLGGVVLSAKVDQAVACKSLTDCASRTHLTLVTRPVVRFVEPTVVAEVIVTSKLLESGKHNSVPYEVCNQTWWWYKRDAPKQYTCKRLAHG